MDFNYFSVKEILEPQNWFDPQVKYMLLSVKCSETFKNKFF